MLTTVVGVCITDTRDRNVLRANITYVLDRNSWAYSSRMYRGFDLRRRCRLEDVMKILRRRGDEDDTATLRRR